MINEGILNTIKNIRGILSDRSSSPGYQYQNPLGGYMNQNMMMNQYGMGGMGGMQGMGGMGGMGGIGGMGGMQGNQGMQELQGNPYQRLFQQMLGDSYQLNAPMYGEMKWSPYMSALDVGKYAG